MITDSDVTWIENNHPSLKINPERTEISGELHFSSTYHEAENIFTPFFSSEAPSKALAIKGSYDVVIRKGKDDKTLPSLMVEISSDKCILDRHFYAPTNKACLCGPTEGLEFMEEGFSLFPYLKRFVIPFLYGQSFYDIHERWPWPAYEHGAAGVLQSYQSSGKTIEHARACLQKLAHDKVRWGRIRGILLGNERIIGTSKCLCPARGEIRSCHPSVWLGIIKLKQSLRSEIHILIRGLENSEIR